MLPALERATVDERTVQAGVDEQVLLTLSDDRAVVPRDERSGIADDQMVVLLRLVALRRANAKDIARDGNDTAPADAVHHLDERRASGGLRAARLRLRSAAFLLLVLAFLDDDTQQRRDGDERTGNGHEAPPCNLHPPSLCDRLLQREGPRIIRRLREDVVQNALGAVQVASVERAFGCEQFLAFGGVRRRRRLLLFRRALPRSVQILLCLL